jgi:hypothetical protein
MMSSPHHVEKEEEKAAGVPPLIPMPTNDSTEQEQEQEDQEQDAERIVPYTDAELLAAVCSPEQLQMVEQIRARRGGRLLNLDRMLLHSPPVASGWNALFGKIRGEMLLDGQVCTVT